MLKPFPEQWVEGEVLRLRILE